jgi:hypothetical protein
VADELYFEDTLAWSESQAELLRRLARGERVSDLDWPHVIEEIEDVGQTQLRALRSMLRQALVHLLKVQGWPDCDAVPHWRLEVRHFLVEARDCFAPSMRQRVELAAVYLDALDLVQADVIDGRKSGALPAACPFVLDDLLVARPDLVALEAKLRPASGPAG